MSKLRRFCGYCWTTLLGKDMPVMWTLVLLTLGVLGTYYITPLLNAKFETAKIKAQYVSDSLKTLNSDTSELVVSVRTLNGLLYGRSDSPQTSAARTEVANRITRLKWKAIELSTIAESESEKNLILSYSEALDALSLSTQGAISSDGIKKINEDVATLLERTYVVLRLLAKKADLRISLLDSK